MPDLDAARVDGAVRLTRIGGVAALLGGLAWTVKGLVILAGGDQPPLLVEVAPALFGVGLLGVARSTMPPGRRRTTALGLAAGAAAAGLAALVSELLFVIELVGDVAGAGLAISSVALLIGLLTLERNRRWPARLGWWIGIAMVPALVVGGVLSAIDERLLEIPIALLGMAWMVVGWAMLHSSTAQAARLQPGGDEG